MHSFFAICVLVSSCFVYANAINCFACIGNSPSCLYPNKNITTSCSQHNRELEYQLQSIYGDKYTPPTAKGSDQINCLHYERQYPNNRTEIFRGCLSSDYSKDYCAQQVESQKTKYNFYNLTICNVCKTDLCNSGYKPEFSLMAAIFLACVVVASK